MPICRKVQVVPLYSETPHDQMPPQRNFHYNEVFPILRQQTIQGNANISHQNKQFSERGLTFTSEIPNFLRVGGQLYCFFFQHFQITYLVAFDKNGHQSQSAHPVTLLRPLKMWPSACYSFVDGSASTLETHPAEAIIARGGLQLFRSLH